MNNAHRRGARVSRARRMHHRIGRRSLAAIAAVMFIVLAPPARATDATAEPDRSSTSNGLHRNDRYGYVVSYPSGWLPSGIVYANAFELRNYDAERLTTTPVKDRASVLIVDTVGESAEGNQRLIEEMSADPNVRSEPITVNGRRGVKLSRVVGASPLGRGASRGAAVQEGASPESLYMIDVYIANGRHLISLEARVSVDADPSVLDDIAKIQRSLGFYKSRVR